MPDQGTPDAEPLGVPRIDDEGLHLPVDLRANLTLDIGGRRVWVVAPEHDGQPVEGRVRLVPWPELLRPHLDGEAVMTLASLDSGETVLEERVRLGGGEGTIDPRDPDGRPLSVDKGQKMTRMFSDADDAFRRGLVDAVAQVLDLMKARGHAGFLAYGNLLGAVRDGRLIGHDNDADVAFLARSSHPVGVILESFAHERAFVAEGWESHRLSPGTFKLIPHLEDGLRTGLDVFAAFYYEGLLHMMPYVAADLPREKVLPLSTVVLEGREVDAPADPEAMLEATYGPGWRVPDPAFHYETPRWLRRRLKGLMRGERKHEPYWQTFYSTKATRVPAEPSSFARWVAELPTPPTSVLDVGCGTGRDSVWLAEQGLEVLGCDYSRAAVTFAEQRARELDCPVEFRRLNLYDLRELLVVGALLARERSVDGVYARFLVHALEEDGRHNLWRLARSVLAPTRGRLFLEFRTEATEHEFGEHFREFVQPEVVADELARHGFAVEHTENRHGLAVHRQEDPRVCRMIARLEG
jgi:SAM-dependent methyltransferase